MLHQYKGKNIANTITTDHSSILGVAAVGFLPALGRAVAEFGLRPSTRHAVHVDGTASLAEVVARLGLLGPGVPELSTHHRGVGRVPLVVAYSAPAVVTVDLNSAA